MSLIRFIFRLLVVALMISLFTCCKSSKKIQKSKEEAKTEQIKEFQQVTEKKTEIEWYDGMLGGNIPIIEYPKKEQDSIVTRIESRGVELDLVVTNKGISYKAKAKPTANIKTEERTEKKDSTKTITETKKESESQEEKESPFKPSTFFWIILALGILVFVYLNRKRFIN